MITAIRASQNSVRTTVAATNTITIAAISTSTARTMIPRYVAPAGMASRLSLEPGSALWPASGAVKIALFRSYGKESSQQIGLNWPTGYAHLAGSAADR